MSEPVLRVQTWTQMDAAARAQLSERGISAIFDPALMAAIGELVEDVRANGDAAVLRALERFDKVALDDASQLRIDPAELEAAHAALDPDVLAGIRAGIVNLRAFNVALTAERAWRTEIAPGLTVGEKSTPVASAGLFVPAGKGSFPSVLMQLGVPALVAGVPHVAVVTPPVGGRGPIAGAVDPAVLAVAHELGLTEVYRSNGPAGVAALALGTETFPRMRKVLGPGSPPVQAAQILCQAHGTHTQMLLGPSESLIIADETADVPRLAADLLNEAEHGPDSASILVTDSRRLVEALQPELAAQLADLPPTRAEYARGSLGERGGAILVADMAEAAEVTNEYAPEHMQIATADDEAVLALIEHAGEILLGQDTPVAAANFALGVPAALPTGGYARVTGGVTAETFLKKASIAHATEAALATMAPGILALADHEGFPAHAAAVRRRLPTPRTGDTP